MNAVHPLPNRPRTLVEMGAHPQPGDVLRIREGEYVVELRVESIDKGTVRHSRTVSGCIMDALMFRALCGERGAEVGK